MKISAILGAAALSAVLAGALLTPQFAHAKTFYKWVDSDGVTHYSARKPRGQEAEEVEVKGGRTTKTSPSAASANTGAAAATQAAAPQQQTAPAGAAESDAALANKDPERCKAARERLQTLESYARVRIRGEDGQLRYLSQQEKDEKLQEAKQAIQESC